MVSGNYMWSGDVLWIASGTITPVLMVENKDVAPSVDDGGSGGEKKEINL